MRSLYLPVALACLLAGPAQALETTTGALVKTSYVSSRLTSAPFDRKLILAAREDAASFVASNGQRLGVSLQAAIRELRHAHPELDASDLELAQAILVQ
ncbi:Holliday junction resolvase [Stutzerimonas balearica]|uniref:DUF2388 domain-containing protein n=1 Tax=Stutzerimonas balearica TaxID=74829 RepID=UPI0007737B65|nr:DUF2388 domain-containing protein [Stutzerimonas balearica]OMG64299.1 Holliday junction resolvase [Stutzerimonas balearica]